MSVGSPKLARREQAIEATRRRLRRLEIEAHRIKAELARLEAEYEDDVADWLSRKLRRRTPPNNAERSQPAHDRATPIAADGASGTTVFRFDRTAVAGVSDPGYKPSSEPGYKPGSDPGNIPSSDPGIAPSPGKASPTRRVSPPLPQIVFDAAEGLSMRGNPRGRGAAAYRKAASPLLFSFAVHIVAMCLCITFTIATIAQQEVELFASPADVDVVAAEEFNDVEIPPTKFEDAELQNVVQENQEFNIADNLLRALEPTQLGAGSQPLGDVGQLDALPSELGTLTAGAGAPGSGQPGGPPGEAVFFGARSKGDRFVFVVDNSSSMKGGRLEAAIGELLKTTDALAPRQSFYVIFVSDQPYPMFYPVAEPDLIPATSANKKRLAEWLPNAILASGNNRQLIKAMDKAAALRPHAVFLLWDGDMKYSEKVRLEVMTHLTRPNQWNLALLG